MKLLRSIIGVTLANIVNFGTSFIIGFILPAVLSISEYGYYRQYVLYLSFNYLFNFGFNDGIYIYYGGKDIDNIDRRKLNSQHNFILIFQAILFIPMLVFSIKASSIVMLLFSISTFIMTIITFHQNFFQAVGNFSTFSKGNIFKSILYIIFLLIGIFILKSESYVVFILINIISLLFLLLYYEFNFYKAIGISRGLNLNESVYFFKSGLFILIANMSLTFVGNIGNWIANVGFDIESFAQYSFQNSILGIILLIVSSVGQVFYNLISKYNDDKTLYVIKLLSIILGVISGCSFFIFSIIINIYLSKYSSSIGILSIIYLSIPYIIVSKILFANMYKALRTEKKYFMDSLIYAVISFIFVGIVFLLTRNLFMIAFAITITYILWYLYCSRFQFSILKGDLKELILLGSHFIVFALVSTYLKDIEGLIIYFIYSVLVLLFYRNELKSIIKIFKESKNG